MSGKRPKNSISELLTPSDQVPDFNWQSLNPLEFGLLSRLFERKPGWQPVASAFCAAPEFAFL
jgi:hypothetical protein